MFKSPSNNPPNWSLGDRNTCVNSFVIVGSLRFEWNYVINLYKTYSNIPQRQVHQISKRPNTEEFCYNNELEGRVKKKVNERI